MAESNQNIQDAETVDVQLNLPYTHCLNCGAELKGMFCHSCGQAALNKKPTIGGFIMAYLDNAYMWDSQFFKTVWTLIRRPGHLTQEYNAGKFISQEHPLKLNMFLLFIFVTLFVFFASADKMNDSVLGAITDERVLPHVQLNLVMEDPDMSVKIQESMRDTVLLWAPLDLNKQFSQIINHIETIEDTGGQALDKWVAVVPHALIEDEILVIDENGCYKFNTDIEIGNAELALLGAIWSEMSDLTSTYFPMLLLLTAPLLTFSLRVVQRKSKIPHINHFIFALHYTAFLEFLMICIYVLYLTITPSMDILEFVMMIGSCVYLAIAYHRVYASSWVKAVVKSLLTSFIYFTILLLIFMAIFIFACIATAINMT